MTGTGPTEIVGSLAVLARVADLLRELTSAEITELVEGRARLVVVPRPVPAGGLTDPTGIGDGAGPGHGTVAGPVDGRGDGPVDGRGDGPGAVDRHRPARRAAPASAAELDEACAALGALSTRDEGARYLSSWTVARLRALAARLEMRGVTGLRRADLIERIVGQTVSFRLNSTAIRRL